MRGLNGKVGVVAGGGRGIGAATARRLAEEGAAVVIGDIAEDWAKEVAASITAAGGRAIGVHLDGTKAASQAAIVQAALDEFGAMDFYHSNLAGGTEGDIDALNCTEEVLDRSFAINSKSHVFATQAALPGWAASTLASCCSTPRTWPSCTLRSSAWRATSSGHT